VVGIAEQSVAGDIAGNSAPSWARTKGVEGVIVALVGWVCPDAGLLTVAWAPPAIKIGIGPQPPCQATVASPDTRSRYSRPGDRPALEL